MLSKVDNVYMRMIQRKDKFIKLKSPHVEEMSSFLVYFYIYLVSRNFKGHIGKKIKIKGHGKVECQEPRVTQKTPSI